MFYLLFFLSDEVIQIPEDQLHGHWFILTKIKGRDSLRHLKKWIQTEIHLDGVGEIPHMYLETSQIFIIEHFEKIGSGRKPLIV